MASLLAASAQDQPGSDKFVSKEDYSKLKSDHDQLKQELDALKAQMQTLLKQPKPADSEGLKARVQELEKKEAAQQADTDQAVGDLEKRLNAVKQMAKDSFPGTTKMLIGGYGSATFTAASAGYGPSQPPAETTAAADRVARNFFTASFNPIFLWKLSDRLFFEGELEL
jgi:hypothetical protein